VKVWKENLLKASLPRKQEFLRCFDFRKQTKKYSDCFLTTKLTVAVKLISHRGRERNMQGELI